MNAVPESLRQLIAALQCLPGIGPKSAQRCAFHLMNRDPQAARHLADSLVQAVERIRHCKQCRMLAESDLCALCSDGRRDDEILCVVESPADVWALEAATDYHGRYFVLLGRLSPLDGVGPEALGFDLLQDRLSEGIREIVIATGTTVEGEATAHWIGGIAADQGIRVTRLAHGVPIGGELEYVDGSTLAHAFIGRRELV